MTVTSRHDKFIKHIVICFLCFISVPTDTCSAQKKQAYTDMVIESTMQLVENDIDNYLESSYNQFNDSINSNSGFLGWKNIRDNVGLGDESMKEKSERIWLSVYDSTQVTTIARSHLESACIALGHNPAEIELKTITGEKQIGIYAYKIGLSFIGLILEEFFEFLLNLFAGMTIVAFVVFVYISYMFSCGGWIRWSRKRRQKVADFKQKIATWTRRVVIVSFIALTWYNGDLTGNQIKRKIKSELINEVAIQVENNLYEFTV